MKLVSCERELRFSVQWVFSFTAASRVVEAHDVGPQFGLPRIALSRVLDHHSAPLEFG